MAAAKQAIENYNKHINKTCNQIKRIERLISKLKERREILMTRLWLQEKDIRGLYQLINERPDLLKDEDE